MVIGGLLCASGYLDSIALGRFEGRLFEKLVGMEVGAHWREVAGAARRNTRRRGRWPVLGNSIISASRE